ILVESAAIPDELLSKGQSALNRSLTSHGIRWCKTSSTPADWPVRTLEYNASLFRTCQSSHSEFQAAEVMVP
ncbi:hypothetical protein PgNI_11130, partial [Pyricularia grisea]|uniref:Uncharacterized protein n=1 Tax=Pyricularia grisea TaxID=148305 RepID=A0A6P8AP89_PYRGI